MITEPEMAEGPDAPEGGAPAAVVLSADDGRGRRRPWPWVVGTAAATCAVGALVLQAVGYGQARTPDLHGYHLGSPCAGDTLGPLADAFGMKAIQAGTATVQHGPAVDAVQCAMGGRSRYDTYRIGDYSVIATVQLHKKTDPTAEFEDAARGNADVVDPLAQEGGRRTERSRPVDGLGDEAFLLTFEDHLMLMARHGGAVFVLNLRAAYQLATDRPLDADGLQTLSPPPITRFAPALERSMRQMMAAAARPAS
jgi:hypothetical protein